MPFYILVFIHLSLIFFSSTLFGGGGGSTVPMEHLFELNIDHQKFSLKITSEEPLPNVLNPRHPSQKNPDFHNSMWEAVVSHSYQTSKTEIIAATDDPDEGYTISGGSERIGEIVWDVYLNDREKNGVVKFYRIFEDNSVGFGKPELMYEFIEKINIEYSASPEFYSSYFKSQKTTENNSKGCMAFFIPSFIFNSLRK